MRILLACIAVLLFCSCTFNEPRLRPEPIAAAAAPPWGRLQGDSINLSDGLAFRCVEWHSFANYPGQFFLEMFTGWHSTMDECVYLTVDPTTVMNFKKTTENKIKHGDTNDIDTIVHRTDDLVAVSDYNCNNFLAGAFAAKVGTNFSTSLASTILSGSSAVLGLATGVPALVPAGISAGNGAISGGNAAFNSNFFANQSFDVMEGAILAERKLQRAEINARICQTYKDLGRLEPASKSCKIQPKLPDFQGYTPTRYWVMSEALSDVIEYDRSCSIEGGLRELSSAAAQKQRQADAAAGLEFSLPTPTPSPTPTPVETPKPAASPGRDKPPAPPNSRHAAASPSGMRS